MSRPRTLNLRHRFAHAAALLAPIAALAPAVARAQVSILNLGVPTGGQAAFAHDINASGAVVGTAWSGTVSIAFRWTEATGPVLLPRTSLSTNTAAYAINDAGEVIGSERAGAAAPFEQLARWSPTNALTLLGRPNGIEAAIGSDVSNTGVAVGVATRLVTTPVEVAFTHAPFVAPTFVTSAANAITRDGSTLAGWSRVNNRPVASTWPSTPTTAALPLPPGAVASEAMAAHALAAGGIGFAGEARSVAPGLTTSHAVLWNPDRSATVLGTLPGDTRAVAFDLNASGVAVGFSDGPRGQRAFVWHASMGMVELERYLAIADAATWTLQQARAVNDRNEVVGFGLVDLGGGVLARRGFLVRLGDAFPFPLCAADLDGDRDADIFDILAFFTAFGSANAQADFDDNGSLDIFDILAFFTAFGAC